MPILHWRFTAIPEIYSVKFYLIFLCYLHKQIPVSLISVDIRGW